MIWLGNGKIKFEDGEPAFRSCWECNGSHEHLRKSNFLMNCFSCGRFWLLGDYLPEAKTDEDIDSYFKSKGIEVGKSTQEIKEV